MCIVTQPSRADRLRGADVCADRQRNDARWAGSITLTGDRHVPRSATIQPRCPNFRTGSNTAWGHCASIRARDCREARSPGNGHNSHDAPPCLLTNGPIRCRSPACRPEAQERVLSRAKAFSSSRERLDGQFPHSPGETTQRALLAMYKYLRRRLSFVKRWTQDRNRCRPSKLISPSAATSSAFLFSRA